MARLYGELNTNISPNIDCPRDKITGSYLSDDDGFLYGELNQKAEKITYIGKSNDTIDLIVDNRNRTIEAVSKLSTGDIETHIKNITIHVTSEDKTNWNNKYTKPIDGIPYLDLSKSVQLSLDRAESSIQEETDPTVPSWAKQPNKPTYTKLEVGLGNVDDIKQYSASNPPPYPVNSVNGQTGDVVLHIPTIPDGVILFSDINKNSPTPLTSVSLRYIRDDDNDIEYVVPQGTYSKPAGGIPASDLASGVLPSYRYDPDDNIYRINDHDISAKYDGNADEIVSKYATKTEMNTRYSPTNPPPYPVSSVNGKTGIVTLVPSDLGIGSVFTLKGSKTEYSQLPSTGNVVGDVWYVSSESVGYIWLWDGSAYRWEKLGMDIDLSAYRTASAQDLIDNTQNTAINAKYTKPSDGIPKEDLASSVQTSLSKAENALQEHQDISGKADITYVDDEIDSVREALDEKAWVDESEDYGEVFNPISAQATPLVANSVSEMTNTNRFYVLVSNQHIYYHNGTTWADSMMVYSGGFIALINSKSDFDSFINGNDYVAFVSDVSITSPVTIPSAKKCEHKRIVGGTIRLSSNLFTWSNAGTPTNLPHFDSCVFVGNGYNVAPNGAYATNGHFANCSFLDCGLVSSGAFAQSQRFVNCRIAMNTNHPFILANCVYECRFIACQCESDNKSQLIYATNTNTSLRSVSHTTIVDSIFEGQTTEVIKMKDGSVYLNDLYTASIKQFIKVEESPMSTNPIIKIVCKNCGFISDVSSVIFDIDESYSGSTRTEISITDTTISVGKLISELEYRKYYLKNISADSGGNFMPSSELSKIGGNKNSIADFTTTGHCIVKKFPCLITFDSNDGTRHTNLYFVSLAGTNPSVICLSDPTKTPTITYNSTTGHCDITLHANRYTQSNTSAVLLDGIDNALIRNGYYRATDGYDA